MTEESTLEEMIYTKLSPLMVNTIAKVWLMKSEKESQEDTASFEDLLRFYSGAKAARFGKVVFSILENELAEVLQSNFKNIFGKKDWPKKLIVAQTAVFFIENHPLKKKILEECGYDPFLTWETWGKNSRTPFNSEKEEILRKGYEKFLLQLCELIIDLYETLPSWNEENIISLLQNQDFLLERSRLVLKRWKESPQISSPDSSWSTSDWLKSLDFVQVGLQNSENSSSRTFQIKKSLLNATKIQEKSLPLGIKQIRIQNFQCIQEAGCEIPVDSNWVLLTGENGEGKTSILQAIAIGMYDLKDALDLLEDQRECIIEVEFQEEGYSGVHRVYWEQD